MIDIFICTYNPNHEYLKRTVDAILAQSLDRNLWYLTIIDNNSSSPVKDIGFVKELNLNVVEEPTPGLTAARICAAKLARHELLIFVDDDNILDKDYLFYANEAFTNHEIGILCGAIYPEYVEQPDDWVLENEEMLAIRRFEGNEIIYNNSTLFNNLFPIGAGMTIKKNLLKEYFGSPVNKGNFIEGRKGKELTGCEDVDIDFYALYAGEKIGYYPKMKMIHILPPSRLKLEYFLNLSVSGFKSVYQVNQKWAPVFGHNVYNTFDYKMGEIIFRLITNKIWGYFNKTRHLRARFYSELYKVKNINLQ